MEAEGCFFVGIQKSKTQKIGFDVQLKFILTQHSRDTELMKSIIKYLDCGNYRVRNKEQAGDFSVAKFSDISEKIIPFFDKYPLIGVKSLDYADFKRVADTIKVKGHLTEDGLDKIRLIKAGMNRGRES